jgi:hypothetical protein
LASATRSGCNTCTGSRINDVYRGYVKGHNPADYFGIYDVVREDTFWLDKT